jgi:predicted metal-dependent HD superfamily phosphohydrolase
MSQYSAEIATRRRFEFGKNWQRFLQELTDEKTDKATISLKAAYSGEVGHRFR